MQHPRRRQCQQPRLGGMGPLHDGHRLVAPDGLVEEADRLHLLPAGLQRTKPTTKRLDSGCPDLRQPGIFRCRRC